MQLPMKLDFPFWWSIKLLLKQQLDKVMQNMVIYEWGTDQLFSEAERLRQIIDLWDTADKTQYFVITKCKSIIFFLSFEHCLFSYLILIRHWQLREEICHYSVKSMSTITHEQNIIYRRTNLLHKMHHPTNIFRQLFTGHAVCSNGK